jgi:hypothetical protein
MAYSFGQLPRITNYAQALEHFHSVKPIKGREPECRPLGLRRRTEATIDVVRDSTGEITNKVLLKYFGQTLISFDKSTPDEMTIHSTGRWWVGMSTASYIERVTGMLCYVHNHGMQLHEQNFRDSKVHRVFAGMRVRVSEDNGRFVLSVLNPRSQKVYRVNRKKMNEVMRNYSGFVEYMQNIAKISKETTIPINKFQKLGGQGNFIEQPVPVSMRRFSDGMLDSFLADTNKAGEITESNLEQIQDAIRIETELRAGKPRSEIKGYDNHHSYMNRVIGEMFVMYMGTLDNLKKIAKALREEDYDYIKNSFYRYAYSFCDVHMRSLASETVVVSLDAKQLRDGFASVMKVIHADVIFEKEELPIGKTVKDRNRRYVEVHNILNSLKEQVYIPVVCK